MGCDLTPLLVLRPLLCARLAVLARLRSGSRSRMRAARRYPLPVGRC